MPVDTDQLRNTTCGELSCDDCNAQREAAADEIDRLRADLAAAKPAWVEGPPPMVWIYNKNWRTEMHLEEDYYADENEGFHLPTHHMPIARPAPPEQP